MRRFAGEAWGALGVNIVDRWCEYNAAYFDGALRVRNSDERAASPGCAARRGSVKSQLAIWQQLAIAASIKKRIGESMKVPALARFVYLSPSCCRRAFIPSFGMPKHRYFVRLARDLTLDAERKSLRFGVAALIEERREGR